MDFVTRSEVPPVLYVAVADQQSEGRSAIKMMRMKDGAVAIAAYSSLDRLRKFAGDESSWILLHTPQLKERASEMKITTILIDPWMRGLPEEA